MRRLCFLIIMLVFSLTGMAQTKRQVKAVQDSMAMELKEVRISTKRRKYSRKNNPAVEMIQKVIEAKKHSDLHRHDYVSFRRYERMTMALNDVTENIFKEDKFRWLPFLKDYVVRNPVTGKLTIPFICDEKQSRIVYRREDNTEKTIVEATRHEGMDDLVKTGEVLKGLMDDSFTDVDIYDDDIRLFQYHFISPISTSKAIRFYHYYIEDTLMVERDKCYKLGFTPAVVQDFGFSGALYILADSTWRVRRAEINVPHRTDINFVKGLNIAQEFVTLPTGEQICSRNDMLLQLSIVDWLQQLQVERRVGCSDWDFAPIAASEFAFTSDTRIEPGAADHDKAFWQEARPTALSEGENRIGNLKQDFLSSRGFKGVLWLGKAFIESYIETNLKPDKPSYVDIGSVYEFVGSNFVEGFCPRIGAQTTGHLNPHWFLSGWGKYGFKDKRWKGEAKLTYSPRRCKYAPIEFPLSNISLSYTNDVRSPMNHFNSTSDGYSFSMFEWSTIHHMNYFTRYHLLVDWEWENGLRLTGQVRRERNTPTGDLFYCPVKASAEVASTDRHIPHMTYSEATLGVTYQPHASYVCTKMNRLQTNFDTPVLSLSHTVGVKGIWGGDYHYNYTQFSVYKRFWWRSWGKMDCNLRGAAQWNRVPWTLLVMPDANTSYFLDFKKRRFTMMRDMEFLSDRALTLTVDWDLNGKILNRIPLIRHLKWRENIGINMMWGMLTDRNNPTLARNAGSDLLMFPGTLGPDGMYSPISSTFNRCRPYIEITAGFHNIFRFFRVEYVRRLTYLHDNTKRWGIRGCFEFTF